MRMTILNTRCGPRLVAIMMALAASLLLAACGKSDASPAPTPTVRPHPTQAMAATPIIQPTVTPMPTYAVPAGTPVPAAALVLRVNGRPVYLREYEALRDDAMRYIWQHQHVDPMSTRGKQLLTQQTAAIQEQLISRELILAFAEKHHLSATKAEIQQQVQQAGGQAVVDRRLAAVHMTMKDFATQVTISKAEFYVVDHHTYQAAEVHVRQILVDTRAKAEAVRKQLVAPHADFATLAEQNSLDQTSKNRGGDLGFVTQVSLGPILGKVAFSLPLNTISQPIKSPLGYHIIEVLARIPNIPLAGTELNQAKLAYFQQWYAAQRKAAHVEVFVQPG